MEGWQFSGTMRFGRGRGGGGSTAPSVIQFFVSFRFRSMLEKKKKKGEKALAVGAAGTKNNEENVAEEEEDLDILKLFDEDDSLLDGELEEEETRLQQDAVTEDPVDPEERKMSVRKLAEIKMKAKQVRKGCGS